jgi:hypothetical protein
MHAPQGRSATLGIIVRERPNLCVGSPGCAPDGTVKKLMRNERITWMVGAEELNWRASHGTLRRYTAHSARIEAGVGRDAEERAEGQKRRSPHRTREVHVRPARQCSWCTMIPFHSPVRLSA